MDFTRHSKAPPASPTQQTVAQQSTTGYTATRSAAFEESRAYNSGHRRRLREFYSGDWWLNVDYVEDYDRIQAC